MADPIQTTLLDDFNRADDSVPPPGANWTNEIISAGGGLAIITNQVCRSTDAAYRQGGYWNASSPGPDVDIVAEVSELPNADTDGFFVYGRLQQLGPTTVDGYALVVERENATTYRFELWRVTDGTPTTIATGATKPALAVGDLIALQLRGTTIKGFRKPAAGSWTEMVTVTDSTYTAAGRVGLEFVNNQAAKITNFWATTLAAPVNTVAPAVTGNKWRTQTLTTTDGTWTGTPTPTYTYQWQRDNNGGGVYSNISGATASTRVLDANDVGCQVRCVVTGTNSEGSASANSNASSIGDYYSAPVASTGRVDVCGTATITYTGESLRHIHRTLLGAG